MGNMKAFIYLRTKTNQKASFSVQTQGPLSISQLTFISDSSCVQGCENGQSNQKHYSKKRRKCNQQHWGQVSVNRWISLCVSGLNCAALTQWEMQPHVIPVKIILYFLQLGHRSLVPIRVPAAVKALLLCQFFVPS